jgi:hypothetical protein
LEEISLTAAIEVPSYVELLRAIGIPGFIKGERSTIDVKLAEIAKLNKISLLYLSSSTGARDHDLMRRYRLLLETLQDVCSAFNKQSIRYCVFKTIKPFPTTPSDVDILLHQDDLQKAESLLISSGYIRTAHDAYSSTLEKEMIVDLQLQPSVSNVPYLPKMLLMKNAVIKNINGIDVYTLSPEAELIVIAAHAIYKEQMFTMNDYYAITLLAEHADPMLLHNLADSASVTEVVRLAVALCSQITAEVFDSDLKVSHLSHELGSPTKWTIQAMPLKFPFSMVVKLLLSRAAKDKDMRTKVLPAIFRIASPRQIAKIVSHIRRKTY